MQRSVDSNHTIHFYSFILHLYIINKAIHYHLDIEFNKDGFQTDYSVQHSLGFQVDI